MGFNEWSSLQVWPLHRVQEGEEKFGPSKKKKKKFICILSGGQRVIGNHVSLQGQICF